MSIKWRTGPVQNISENGFVTFVWLAGINCNTNEQPFDLKINETKILTFSTRFAEEWYINGLDNSKLKFSTLYQDVNGDLFGYMFLTIRADNLEQNKAATLSITGQAKITYSCWICKKEDKCLCWCIRKFPPGICRKSKII